jgi:hypothetical protein
MAEFLLQLKYYEDAENKFMFVTPEDMIEEEEEMKPTMLNNHELQALKGTSGSLSTSRRIPNLCHEFFYVLRRLKQILILPC